MSPPHFHWFLPTTEDGPFLAAADDRYRRPSAGYLTDVARAPGIDVPVGNHIIHLGRFCGHAPIEPYATFQRVTQAVLT